VADQHLPFETGEDTLGHWCVSVRVSKGAIEV
jgi:hypothetical protein